MRAPVVPVWRFDVASPTLVVPRAIEGEMSISVVASLCQHTTGQCVFKPHAHAPRSEQEQHI